MAKREEVLGVRLSAAELDALRALAQREERSPASWLRFRVKQESERWGIPFPAQPLREAQHGQQAA